MTERPTQTLRLASGVARRALISDLALWLGRTLLGGALAACLAVTVAKAAGWSIDWWWLTAPPLALGLIAGVLVPLSRRWSPLRAASETDRALALKDKLSSAVALAAQTRDDGAFEAWSIAEAESIASGVQPNQVVRVRWGWPWMVWPALAAGAAVASVLIPAADWSRPDRPRTTLAEQKQAAEQIRTVAEAVREGLNERELPAATDRQIQELEALERELAEGRADPAQSVTRAAGAMESLAESMNAESAERQEKADAMRERLARAAETLAQGQDRPTIDESASPLIESLRRGDAQSAGDLASEYAQRLQEMTPEERERLARELDELADMLEAQDAAVSEPSSAPGQESQPPQPTSGRSPRESTPAQREPESAPDQKPPPPQPQTPGQPDQRPEASGEQPQASEDQPTQAQEPARREQGEPQQPPSGPQPDQPTPPQNQLEQQLRDAAKELRGQKPQPKPEQSPGSEQRPPFSNEHPDPSKQDPSKSDPSQPDASKPGQRDQTQEGQRQQNGQQDQPTRPDQPSQQPGTQPQQTPPAQPQSQPPPQSKPGEKTPKPDPAQQEQPSQSGEPGSDGKQAPRPDPTQHPDGRQSPSQGKEQSNEQGSRPQPAPGQQQPQQTGQKQQDGQPQPQLKPQPDQEGQPEGVPNQPGSMPTPGQMPDAKAPDAQALERLAEQLKGVARSQRDAQIDQKRARELQDMARKMMENATPEQREQFRKMAEEFARNMRGDGAGSEPGTFAEGPPARPFEGRTEPVDARRSATASGLERPREKTIAEWYSDKPIDRSGVQQAPAIGEALREAAGSAERSIEGQQVPGRYQDLVRRVFRRYAEDPPR